MKGKKLLTLLSVFCGAAIVGTTFAAWAVTDKADPFGIKVTPGGSSEDETGHVTLEYGSTFMAENLTNLTSDHSKVAAKVGLKATTSTGGTYEGKFSMELEDLSGKSAGDTRLIDNLTVKLFNKDSAGEIAYDATTKVVTDQAALDAKTPDATIPVTGDNPFETSKNYVVTSGTEKIVYVIVSLKANLTPAVLDQIKNDHVRITMDWGKGSDDDTESSTVYYKNATAPTGGKYYCYGWTSTGKTNHEWPGVEMTKVDGYTDLYSYELGTQFVKVIFNDGTNQTADLEVPEGARDGTTPCYNGSAWVAKPAQPVTSAFKYHVLGLNGKWVIEGDGSTTGMTPVTPASGDPTEFVKSNVAINANTAFKVKDKDDADGWYSSVDYFGDPATIKAHADKDGNIVVEETGTYNIHFYSNGENSNFVTLEKVSA